MVSHASCVVHDNPLKFILNSSIVKSFVHNLFFVFELCIEHFYILQKELLTAQLDYVWHGVRGIENDFCGIFKIVIQYGGIM